MERKKNRPQSRLNKFQQTCPVLAKWTFSLPTPFVWFKTRSTLSLLLASSSLWLPAGQRQESHSRSFPLAAGKTGTRRSTVFPLHQAAGVRKLRHYLLMGYCAGNDSKQLMPLSNVKRMQVSLGRITASMLLLSD